MNVELLEGEESISQRFQWILKPEVAKRPTETDTSIWINVDQQLWVDPADQPLTHISDLEAIEQSQVTGSSVVVGMPLAPAIWSSLRCRNEPQKTHVQRFINDGDYQYECLKNHLWFWQKNDAWYSIASITNFSAFSAGSSYIKLKDPRIFLQSI